MSVRFQNVSGFWRQNFSTHYVGNTLVYRSHIWSNTSYGEICFWKCPVLDVSGLMWFYCIFYFCIFHFIFDILVKNWNLIALAIFKFLIFSSRARLPLLLGTLRMAGPQECPLTPRPLSWCQIVTRHHDTNRQRATLCDVPRPSWRRHWGPHSARLGSLAEREPLPL